MGDFGLFEADAHAQAEPERQQRQAANKLAGAISDVRQQYGTWLTAATGVDEFDDRWNAARHDIRQTVGAHVPPVSGVMRRVKNAMKAEFKRVADLPQITSPSLPSVPGGTAGAVAGAADAMANQAAPGASTATNPGQSDGTTPGHLGRVAASRIQAGFATYRTAGDCVVANSDKDDPHAYCAYIKHQTGPKQGSVHFREVEAGLRRELSRNDLMAAFTELEDLPIKLAGQDGTEPELHTHSTFEDHQGEELIPEGDFAGYLSDVSQGGPGKIERNLTDGGDSGSDRHGYRVAGNPRDRAGDRWADGRDRGDAEHGAHDLDPDNWEDAKEKTSSVALDLYTDFAESNGLRTASLDTLAAYSQTGISDADYHQIEAAIRQAELPPSLTMGYGGGGFDPHQQEELAALAALEQDIRGGGEEQGPPEEGGGGGGFGGGDDEDEESDDESDEDGDDEDDSDDDGGEAPDFGGGDDEGDDGSDFGGFGNDGGGEEDYDDEDSDDDSDDEDDDSESDDEGDDEGDEDEGDEGDFGGGDSDDDDDPDDGGGPPWITSSHERVQLAKDMRWALKADQAHFMRMLAAEDDESGGGDSGGGQQAPQAASGPPAPAGPPQVPDVASGAPAGSPEPTENQPQEDALLDTALQAVMQMVDTKTQNFQQVIDPLQQAVQAIQFAQQVEQSEHPMDVTPPEGTVDASPSAAPGGSQDMQQQQVQTAMRTLQATCDREGLAYPPVLTSHLAMNAQLKQALSDARLAKEITYARAIPQLTRIAKAYGMPKGAVKIVLEAMGRKHYQSVSDAIATLPPEHRIGIAASLADMFAEDNPRFVHSHFFHSAGVPMGADAVPFAHSASRKGGERTAAGNWTLTPTLDTYHFPNAKPPVADDKMDVNNLPGTSASGNPKAAATDHEAKDVLDQYKSWSKGQADKGLNLGDDVGLFNFATQHKVGPKALTTLKTQLGVGTGTPSGGQPAAPKTKAASFFQRRVPGWTWSDQQNGYITTARRDFTCSCGEEIPVPSYGTCRCGKIWNSIAYGGHDHLANNTAEMYIAREIPVREAVVLAANEMMANGEPAYRTASVTPLAASDADWAQWNAHAAQGAPEHDMRSVFHDREDDRFTPRGEIVQAGLSYEDTMGHIDNALAQGDPHQGFTPEEEAVVRSGLKPDFADWYMLNHNNENPARAMGRYPGQGKWSRQAAIGEDDHEVTYKDGERYCSKCDALLWDPNVHHCPAKQASHIPLVHEADWTVYDDDVKDGGPDRPPSTKAGNPPPDWARRGPEKGPSSQWAPPIFR